ncbi:hypothetical protein AB0M46_29860 [Dactylosporangium sp. NPDC051485]|uniref:hypothetical protein n=1 Tax=Dactylosporangium sp. NPDC051485 TaxID=3154846 RepID=UPI00341F41CD
MPDFDNDDELLANAFAGFRNEVTPYVKPAGTAAAHATLRHRNKVRAVAASGLAALAIAVPMVAYAAGGGESNGPPALPADSPSVVVTSTSPAAPSPDASTTPAAPDGRITKADLSNATFNVPAWPKGFDDRCAKGMVKFTASEASGNPSTQIEGDPVYVDVDHDGAQETIVIVSCGTQGTDYKVLALDRDAQGKIVTLGQVVGSAGTPGKEGKDIETIWKTEAGDNGQVRVDVGEYRPCCAYVQASQHQWRTYGWNGTAFTQTAGPTTFGPNPKVGNLSVSAGKLTMVATGPSTWEGTIKVTVHNAASFASPGKVEISFNLPQGSTVQSTDCQIRPDAQPSPCLSGSIPAGGTKVFTIKLTTTIDPQTVDLNVVAAPVTDNGGAYPTLDNTGSAKVQVVKA